VVWQNADMIGDGLNATYGSFVSSSGSAGSPFQINQTDSLDSYEPPAVVFGGGKYLVVWNTDTADDAHGNGLDLTLYGRFVSPGGAMSASETVLAGIPGSSTYNDNSYPNLAFDGQKYLLVWTPSAGPAITNVTALNGQFFDGALNPIGVNFAALPATGTNRPTVALNGLVYDGHQFVLAGGYGLLTPNAAGDFGGIPYWQTWGAIISEITAASISINTDSMAFGVTNGVFGFDVSGPTGSNVVIQASADLKTWIPLQTNLLGNGPLYFSDAPTNHQRFYRIVLLP
jgi:hypothetical protein